MEEKSIKPLTDEVISLTVKGTKSGVFRLNPRISHTDDLGETKTHQITPINLTIQPVTKSG